ncbi:MAG TPA: peptidoglycan-associated lipoprotein Pal [Rhizomicrobium sp.]
MKNISTGLKLAAIAFAFVLAGCETKPPPAPAPAPAPVVTPAPSVIPGSAEDFRVNVGDTVHFDYDKYAILEVDKGTLQKQATWLAQYPSVRVTIEGNADERGTREYNLALGARRANAVKEYLISLGVAAARIETISYGKERPICSESTESCWAQNRRGVTAIAAGANS